MTDKEFIKLYWKQYLSLERDLLESSEYVTIDSKNYGCFSNNYTKIFLMACSELDSISDVFADMIKNDLKLDIKIQRVFPAKIDLINNPYPKFKDMAIITNEDIVEKLRYTPFRKFEENETDDWWKDYNLVKHNRTELNEGGKYNYEKANLKNTMTALAALFLLCYLLSSYINDEAKLVPESQLFEFLG